MANFDNIIQEINTNLPDNNTQSITAAKLRTTLIDLTTQIDTVQDDFEAEVNQAIAEVDPVFATNQSINNVSIVNDFTTGGENNVLSAEQGKIIGSALNLWTLEQGSYLSNDGAAAPSAIRVRIPNFLTGHIKVETTGDVEAYQLDYNLDGSYIGSHSWRTTIEINDYTKLFHILFRKSDDSIITPDDVKAYITINSVLSDIVDLTNTIDTVQDDFEAEVNQAIAEVEEYVNMTDLVRGGISGSQGGIPTDSTTRVRTKYFLTGHIKVETSDDIVFTEYIFNLDGTYINSTVNKTSDEINDTTHLYKIVFKKTDNTAVTPEYVKERVTFNSVVKDIADLNSDIADLNSDIADLNSEVIQYKLSANIHNSAPATVSDTMPTDGSDWYGHNLDNIAANYNSSDYISIDPTVGYKSNVNLRRIRAYSANKTLISGATKESVSSGTEITWANESYASDIAYIRFMYDNATWTPADVKFGKYTDNIDVEYKVSDYDKFNREIALVDNLQEIITTPVRTITISNSDKLLIVGSSSVGSFYTLPLKSWTNKLNDSLDWMFLTYGISGYTCEQLANALKNGSAVGYADGVKPSQIHPTYVFVGHYKNMSSVANESTSDNIIEQNRILMETCKSVFNAPLIVGSDYTNEGSYHGEMAMLQLAKELNADYYPFGAYGNNLLRNQNKPAGLWSGAHPGTKTNNFYYQEAYNIFKNLNQPKQSIKVYTPRTGVSDYTYNTSKERNEKFTSVESGNYALMNNQEYYDRIKDLPSGSTAVSTGDYYRLMKKDTVTLDSKALVEVIVPVVNAEKFEVYVESADIANIAIKVFNNNTGVYDTLTKTNMEGVDGAYITISDVKYVQFDKIKVLLDSESTITINDVYVKCYGGKEKAYKREINANSMSGTPIYQGGNGFGSDWETVWTNGGNCESYIQTTKYGADFEDLPKFLNISTNKIVVLPYNASEKKTISLTIPSTTLNDGVETMLPRLFRVEVYCRTFSKIYNPTAYSEWTGDNNPYTNTPILTSKSYDYTTLGLDVAIAQNNNKVAVFDEQVGQFWSRVLFDVWIPPFTNSDMTFYLYRKPNDFNSDFELQIADVAITRIK